MRKSALNPADCDSKEHGQMLKVHVVTALGLTGWRLKVMVLRGPRACPSSSLSSVVRSPCIGLILIQALFNNLSGVFVCIKTHLPLLRPPLATGYKS
jgi:hypothetical protein